MKSRPFQLNRVVQLCAGGMMRPVRKRKKKWTTELKPLIIIDHQSAPLTVR